MASLMEDAILAEVANPTVPQTPNMPKLDELVAAGKLRKRTSGGQVGYFHPSGDPLGADYSRGQLTIENPQLRQLYQNFLAGEAKGVALDNILRQRENSKARQFQPILEAAGKLEPELQQAVLQILGVRPKQDVVGKTGQAMQLAKYKHQLEQPERQQQLQLRREDLEGRQENRSQQLQLQQQIADMKREANLGQKVQYLKLMQSVLTDPTAPPQLKQQASKILMSGMMELVGSANPVTGQTATPSAQPSTPQYRVRRIQ